MLRQLGSQRALRLVGIAILGVAVCACETPPRLSAAVSLQGPWNSEIALDAGVVLPDSNLSTVVFVRNDGRERIDVITDRSGSNLSLEPEQFVLQAQAVQRVRVTFRSPPLRVLSTFDERTTFVSRGASAALRLSGVIDGECSVPASFDFGVLAANAETTRRFRLRNTTGEALSITAPVIGGDGAGSFSLSTPSSIAALGDAELVVRFAPRTAGDHQAFVFLDPLPGCSQRILMLRGRAVESPLAIPAEFDCGWIATNTSVRREIELRNVTDAEIRIESGRIASPAFEVALPRGAVIGPRGLLSVGLTCHAGVGATTGKWRFSAGGSSHAIVLHVGGAQPRIAVERAVDFGRVAMLSALRTRVLLRVENQGGPDEAPEEATLLRIARIAVTPSGSNTSATEFDVRPTTAIEAGRAVLLDVGLTPATLGEKDAVLRIETNDPATPSVEVTLHGSAGTYSPCTFALSDTALEFGVVHATNPMSRDIVIRNEGATPCLLRVDPGAVSAAEFQFETWRGVELQPGDERVFTVRFQPLLAVSRIPISRTGSLAIQVPSLIQPLLEVPLSGASGPACLGVLPGELNFGSLASGEVSASSAVRIVNHCRGDSPNMIQPLTVTSISLVGDSEFQVASAVPDGGLLVLYDGLSGLNANGGVPPNTQPASVSVSPGVHRELRAAIVMEVEQDGRRRTHVVPLKARLDGSHLTEDTFIQGGADAVDIVLHVDAVSIQWSMDRLVANAGLFIQHLERARSNYRIGVLALGQGKGLPPWRGIFALDGAASSPVVSPLTPNPIASLQSRLVTQSCRDDQGSYFAFCPFVSGGRWPTYSTWRALTPPNSLRFNAGLPRADARLAIIGVSDRAENDAIGPYGWGSYAFPDFPMEIQDTGDIIRLFQEIKGPTRPTLLSFGGLTGLEYSHHSAGGNCTFDNFGEASRIYATPLLVLKANARAAVDEVCPPTAGEFPEVVERMAEVASGLRTHFELSSQIDRTRPVEVLVDGVNVPSSDSSGSVWVVSPLKNEIRFRLDVTPAPGARVEIQYFTPLP